eukprot:TRINITY_DN12416_c0_g1_i1.p2 TRINITY_DN12416_c0_g1~~TRINITY_DN12416_c0_g1_i1.p2  ORF type:complete len:383 (+),score=132.49 TRINITY_DN12416_c0_g1_i1:82-1149(+)
MAAAGAPQDAVVGELKKRSTGWIWNEDQRRYFRLAGTTLQHWEEAPESAFVPPIGSMDLSKAKSVAAEKGTADTFPFAIEWDDYYHPRYFLIAADGDDRERWLKALQGAAATSVAMRAALTRRLDEALKQVAGSDSVLFRDSAAAGCVEIVRAGWGPEPCAVALTPKQLLLMPYRPADDSATAWKRAQSALLLQLPLAALEDPSDAKLGQIWGLQNLDESLCVLVRTPELVNPELIAIAKEARVDPQKVTGITAALRFQTAEAAAAFRAELHRARCPPEPAPAAQEEQPPPPAADGPQAEQPLQPPADSPQGEEGADAAAAAPAKPVENDDNREGSTEQLGDRGEPSPQAVEGTD